MNTKRTLFQQFSDQFSLWLLLSELKKQDYSTQKLKLQKLVYLIDVFGALFARKTTGYTFIVYDYGPFSKEVTNDMDYLVSNGVIEAKEIKLWDPEHERSFDYKIREQKLEETRKVIAMFDLGFMERVVNFTVKIAGKLDSESIRRLVYTEPNYLAAKEIGYKSIINPEYKFTISFRDSARKISMEEFCVELNDEQIALLYLSFMKSDLFNDQLRFRRGSNR